MVTGIGSIPTNTNVPAAFVSGDTLYVIGGGPNMGGANYNTVVRYGLENKTVSYGATMPSGRWSPTYAMGLDGNMYLFGGFNAGYRSDLQIYNPLNNTWWTRSAPTAFGVGAAVTLTNGSIVIFNGAWSSQTTMYNPTKDTWYIMTATPSGIWGGRSAVLINDTAILVMGGDNGGAPFATSEIYNPITDSWSNAANMALAASFGGAVMGSNGYVYHIGGYITMGWPGTTTSVIQRYDLATDSWTIISPTISPGKCTFGIAQDQYGRTFTVGGINAGGSLADIDMILTSDLVESNTIIITSPGANSVVSDTVAVSAMMTSRVSGVDPMLVEFYVDGGLVDNALGSSTIRSWTFMWDTAGLIDGSTHTLMVRAYLDDAVITQDSITVIVSVKSVSDKIADLEGQISDLQAQLQAQLTAAQNQIDDLNTSQAQNITALKDQITALQNQLNGLQTTTGNAKDSAASANTFAMIGMLVAIIVLILVILNMMMSRTKK